MRNVTSSLSQTFLKSLWRNAGKWGAMAQAALQEKLENADD